MLDNDVFAVALIYFWLIIAHEAQAVESISYEAGFLQQPAPAAPSQNCRLPLSGRGLAVRRVDFALRMFKLWATWWLGDYYSSGFDSQEFGELVTLNCDSAFVTLCQPRDELVSCSGCTLPFTP